MNNYVKCPKCGKLMVLRKGEYGEFFGCQRYPKCDGKRNFSEGRGKEYLLPEDLYDNSYGDNGTCSRCGQYPKLGSLSAMGLCPSCQEHFEND